MGSPFVEDAIIPENTPTTTAGCKLVFTGGGYLASVHKQPPASSESADKAATTTRWILKDGHFSRRTTMKVLYATLSAAAFTLSLAGSAGAVDLRNMDKHDTSYDYITVTVTENGQTRQIEIGDGQIEYGVCTACVMRVGSGPEVQVQGTDVVEASGGSLKVSKYPVPIRQAAMLPSESSPAMRPTSHTPALEQEGVYNANAMPGNDPIVGGSDD